MAAHTHLPIYKSTYELLRVAAEITRGMPRDYKLSLGAQIKTECVELVVDVYRAAAARDKRQLIGALLERLEVVQLLLQLSADLRLISLGHHARTLPLTDAIGRQAGGWRKAQLRTTEQRTPGA